MSFLLFIICGKIIFFFFFYFIFFYFIFRFRLAENETLYKLKINPLSKEIKTLGKWVFQQKIVDIIYVKENRLLWLATDNKIIIVDPLNPKNIQKEIQLASKFKIWKLYLLPFENSKRHVKNFFFFFSIFFFKKNI